MNRTNHHAFPSQETIATRTGLCVKTVGTALKQLIETGWLTKSRRGRRGQRGYHNIYTARIPDHIELETIAELNCRRPEIGKTRAVNRSVKDGSDYLGIINEIPISNRAISNEDKFGELQTKMIGLYPEDNTLVMLTTNKCRSEGIQTMLMSEALNDSAMQTHRFDPDAFVKTCKRLRENQ